MESIEPSEFDLIVIGTGLTESIVAAAAAKAGKSVLQLDPAGHYGGSWASLRLDELSALLQGGSSGSAGSSSPSYMDGIGNSGAAAAAVSDSDAGRRHRQERLAAAAGVAGAEVWMRPGAELGASGQYSLDLAPKVAYGAGPLIELLLGSGAHNYLEFKLLQGSYLLDQGGGGGGRSGDGQPQLRSVPSSRSEVFKDRQLSPLQKRSLMRFLKAAAEALDGEGPLQGAFGPQPIQELLQQQGLDAQLQQSLLHGVLLADSSRVGDRPEERTPAAAGAAMAAHAGQQQDQQQQQQDRQAQAQEGLGVLSAAQALERLRLYMQSTGRYGPNAGPFLTPLYGCGELPQAFCRVAAVAGAVQVLRCRAQGLAFDEHTFSCNAVELASGQMIRCQQLAASEDALREWLATFQPAAIARSTHRCCAVLDAAVVPGEQQNMVVVLPAQAASAAAAARPGAVRALALGSSTAVSPPGRHLLYLWADAGNSGSSGGSSSSASPQQQLEAAARKALLPALSALADTSGLQPQPSSSSSSSSLGSGEAATAAGAGQADVASSGGSARPAVLWAAFYTQTSTDLLAAGSLQPAGGGSGGRWPANVALCPGPDSSATFASAVDAAKRCYWQLYPPADSSAAGEAAAAAAAAEALFPLDPRAQHQRQPTHGGEASAAAADADSDDEAVAALQAALGQLSSAAGSAVVAAQEQSAAVEEAEAQRQEEAQARHGA